jgi:hypothetical protein
MILPKAYARSANARRGRVETCSSSEKEHVESVKLGLRAHSTARRLRTRPNRARFDHAFKG